MRAYLINPFKRTITEVDYPGDGEPDTIYKMLSTPEHEVTVFDCARINDRGDGIYVDDEGLFKELTSFFHVSGYHTPLCGCGLVLGTDAEGNSAPPTVTLDWLRDNVHMLQLVGVVNGRVTFVNLPLTVQTLDEVAAAQQGVQ
jgi:hypothetical protein